MFQLLDTVVLTREFAKQGLAKGDLGAVVAVHPDGALEVEFVRASGDTVAVVTVQPNEVRNVADSDVIAVRPTRK